MEPRHKIIWGAMEKLYRAGTTIGPDSVAAALELSGDIEYVGGKPYLLSMVGLSLLLSAIENRIEDGPRTVVLMGKL